MAFYRALVFAFGWKLLLKLAVEIHEGIFFYRGLWAEELGGEELGHDFALHGSKASTRYPQKSTKKAPAVKIESNGSTGQIIAAALYPQNAEPGTANMSIIRCILIPSSHIGFIPMTGYFRNIGLSCYLVGYLGDVFEVGERDIVDHLLTIMQQFLVLCRRFRDKYCVRMIRNIAPSPQRLGVLREAIEATIWCVNVCRQPARQVALSIRRSHEDLASVSWGLGEIK